MDISVIVPVYKEEKSIDAFLARMVPVLNGMNKKYEIIFLDPPFSDNSYLEKLRIIKLI